MGDHTVRMTLIGLLASVTAALAQTPPAPTVVAGSVHPMGAQIKLGTSGCSTTAQVEVYADSSTSSTKIANIPSQSTLLTNVGFVYANLHEGGGPDTDADGSTKLSARYTCNGVDWSSFVTITPVNMPSYLSTYASGMKRAHWVAHDNFNRPNLLNELELADRKLWTSKASCGLDIFSNTARKSGTSNCYHYTPAYTFEDQVLVAYVDCPGCSATNTDWVAQFRTQGLDYYQCKVEDSGSGMQFKWNKQHDVDGDSTLDAGEYGAACGTATDAAVSPPFWIRCEVYDNGASTTELRLWYAPDSAGVPGTWTLKSSVTDNSSTGTCAGGSWSGTGGPLTHGGSVGIGVLKVGDHRWDKVSIGRITENDTPNRVGRLP